MHWLLPLMLILASCGSELPGSSGNDDSSSGSGDDTSATGTVHDSNGNNIETNGTVGLSTDFCMQFNEEINLTTCTDETMTLVCSGSAVSGTVNTTTDTDGVADNECCFDPTETLPAAASCTFAVSGVTDKNANKVAAQSITVTTTTDDSENDDDSETASCTSSDNFSSDTSSCYQFNNTTNQTDTVANTEAAAITIGHDQLKFDMTTTNSKFDAFNNLPSASKEISGNFDVQITVHSMTVDNMNAAIKLIVVPTLNETSSTFFQCSLTSIDCYVGSSNGGFKSDSACDQTGGASGTFSPNISIRVVRTGSSFQCHRKLSGGSFVQVGSNISITGMPTSSFLAITAQSESTAGTAEFVLHDLTFNSGTAVGQD